MAAPDPLSMRRRESCFGVFMVSAPSCVHPSDSSPQGIKADSAVALVARTTIGRVNAYLLSNAKHLVELRPKDARGSYHRVIRR